MNLTTKSGLRKVAVAASVTGLAAVGLAAPSAFAATPHLTPASTKVTGTSSKITFVGVVNGISLTVTCTSLTASGTTPANGLTVPLPTPPKFTGCTDSFGGKDTVVTANKWSIVANSTGSMLTLDLPVKAATFSSSILSGCKLTVAPKATGKITGKYNNAGTWTISGSSFAISGSGCSTGATAKATSTVKFAPALKVVG
jgi:hypothetical protein